MVNSLAAVEFHRKKYNVVECITVPISIKRRTTSSKLFLKQVFSKHRISL